jgi:hypothetical protein
MCSRPSDPTQEGCSRCFTEVLQCANYEPRNLVFPCSPRVPRLQVTHDWTETCRLPSITPQQSLNSPKDRNFSPQIFQMTKLVSKIANSPRQNTIYPVRSPITVLASDRVSRSTKRSRVLPGHNERMHTVALQTVQSAGLGNAI